MSVFPCTFTTTRVTVDPNELLAKFKVFRSLQQSERTHLLQKTAAPVACIGLDILELLDIIELLLYPTLSRTQLYLDRHIKLAKKKVVSRTIIEGWNTEVFPIIRNYQKQINISESGVAEVRRQLEFAGYLHCLWLNEKLFQGKYTAHAASVRDRLRSEEAAARHQGKLAFRARNGKKVDADSATVTTTAATAACSSGGAASSTTAART